MKLPYNRHFPTPNYLAMNSCAIDISDCSIKYGELIPTSFGIRLGEYGYFNIPEGIIVSGKIQNEKELIKIFTDLKKRIGLEFIRVSLPEEQTYLFTLSLPSLGVDDIKESISLQIEEYVPLPATDIVFDFNVIKKDEDEIVVEVVAINKATVLSYLSVFEQSGLTPLSFEVEAQAIARAVIPKGDNSTIMIVDFGNNRTGISVACNERVFLTTTLDMGGYNLTNMIAKNFSISFEDAEKLKKSYGLMENKNIDDIFPIILNGVSVLKDEINKQSDYWKNHNLTSLKEKEINHIILCGGDANLSGLASYLETSMNIKVVNANTWVNISGMEESVPSISFEESLSYATVLGLALADFCYNKPILNLLPERQKIINRNRYWVRFTGIILSMVSLFFVLETLLIFPVYFFSKEKELFAETSLESFNKLNPELNTESMSTIIEDVNNKLSLISEDSVSKISEKIIKDVLDKKPKGISYEQILFSTRADGISVVEIRGIASNRNILRSLSEIFEKDENFETVDLPISNFIESSNINFKISMNIKK